jgi:hypothetical protein
MPCFLFFRKRGKAMIKKNLIRTISLVFVLVLLVSMIPFTASAAATKYQTTQSTCYDSDGNEIISTSQVGKLYKDLKE